MCICEKCAFAKPRVKFIGHIIDAEGIRTDPDKVGAIKDMSPPIKVNFTEVRCFLGMANQLSKFSSNLADLSRPLRALLSKKKRHGYGLKITRKLSKILIKELSSDRILSRCHFII